MVTAAKKAKEKTAAQKNCMAAFFYALSAKFFYCNSVCKPGSVENGHQYSITVTDELRLSPCHPRTYVGQTSDCGVASDRV